LKILSVTVLYFILISQIFPIEKYTRERFLGNEVYFPKSNTEYIEDLIESEDTENLLELSYSYAKLGEAEASRIYMDEYEKATGKKDYLKTSKVWHILGEYTKEVACIEKYIESNPEERAVYYDYMLNLIEEKNLDFPSEKYELSRLDRIFLYMENPELFIRTYYMTEWSEDEYNEIMEFLIDKGVHKTTKLKKFFMNNASKLQIGEYLYKKTEVGDEKSYFSYFSYMERNNLKIVPYDKIEKLYFLKYLGESEEFSKVYSEELNQAVQKKEFNKLYSLYLVSGDLKILYNLALENEDYLYRFIVEVFSRDRELALNLVEEFKKRYKSSKYRTDIAKLEIKMDVSSEKKLQTIDSYLEKEFDLEIFSEKIEILKEDGRVKESIGLIEEKLQYTDLNEGLIVYYIDVMEEIGEFDKLIATLHDIKNKTYYFEVCLKNGYLVDKELSEAFLNYNFEHMNLEYLYDHLGKLSDWQVEKLVERGNTQFSSELNRRKALSQGTENSEGIEYIFFDNKPRWASLEELEFLEKKTPAEYYYLALYYSSMGQYKKSENYLEKIYDKYSLSDKLRELREYNLKNLGS